MTATYVPPKRATAYKFYVALVDQSNTKVFKANPTIAAGDFKVSKDGGAFANLATLPSVNPAGSVAVMVDLSDTEMTADQLAVQCIDAAGAEWCDLFVNIQTTARQVDDLAFPATSGRSLAVSTAGDVDANPTKLGGSTNALSNLQRAVLGNVLGTVGTGSTTTNIVTSSLDPAASKVDQFKGKIITFDRATTTANLRGQSTDVTASTSDGQFTVSALTDAPVSGDTFTIT